MDVVRAFRIALAVALVGAGLAPMALAATYTVGSSGCTHATIQAAINAAAANPGLDTIRVTRSLAYTAQALVVNTAESLELAGGYASCAQAVPDDTLTVIDGGGGGAAPVLRLTTTGVASLRLSRLRLVGGDVAGDGEGGGIRYAGSVQSTLELERCEVIGNSAAYGGGIYAVGNGSRGRLVLRFGNLVSGNTARVSGGGIYVENANLTMDEPENLVALNTATAYGGGIRALGPSVVTIRSGGRGNLGAVYGNTAGYGGGIALQGSQTTTGNAALFADTVDAAAPVRLIANTASERGGALYARADYAEGSQSTVELEGVSLEGNYAATGAAAYMDYSGDGDVVGSSLYMRHAPACPSSEACNRVIGNVARTIGGQPTVNPILVGGDGSYIDLTGTRVVGNVGGAPVYVDTPVEGLGRLRLFSVLVAGNQVAGPAIVRMPRGRGVEIFDTTIAGNVLAGASVIESPGGPLSTLDRSVFWQPCKQTLAGDAVVGHVLASEIASLGIPVELALNSDPRFVDPEAGDFRLRAASPAVDAIPAVGGDDRDADGLPRDQDLSLVPNLLGPRDLGAYERQTLLPLVLNGGFDADARLWPVVTANASQHQAEDHAGQGGSGSLRVTENGGSIAVLTARRQCVNLPGPSTYRLNGFGRGYTSNFLRDTLSLRWRFRRASADCSGPIDQEGSLALPNNIAWASAVSPATIAVTPADWTTDSTIEVLLVATDEVAAPPNDINVAFDAITLSPGTSVPLPDPLFANGFE